MIIYTAQSEPAKMTVGPSLMGQSILRDKNVLNCPLQVALAKGLECLHGSWKMDSSCNCHMELVRWRNWEKVERLEGNIKKNSTVGQIQWQYMAIWKAGTTAVGWRRHM
jgi:hypothetical protein